MNTQDVEECAECVLPAGQANDDGSSLLCVRCPFCKQTVNAVVTPATIECPECKTVVTR